MYQPEESASASQPLGCTSELQRGGEPARVHLGGQLWNAVLFTLQVGHWDPVERGTQAAQGQSDTCLLHDLGPSRKSCCFTVKLLPGV